MSSTYSTNLALELIGTGDQAGTWGNTTNTNLGTLIEQAISGYVTQAVSTGTDTTITIPNGATGVARNMYIELTGTGGASTNLIVPANKKLYFIFNNTSSGQVTVKVSGQTGVSVPNKAKIILVSNGTDVVDATNYIGNISAASANITVLTSASATITNLIATSASITTLTNNPTFSGGTANGVLFLNGSKVATSGSALTFDGTTFGAGTTTFKVDTSSNRVLVNLAAAIQGDSLEVAAKSNGGAISLFGRASDNGSQISFRANGAATQKAAIYGSDVGLDFQTGTTIRATIDTSGNLGLGVTPSAWSGFGKTMEFNNAGCYVGNSGATSMQVGANNYFTGSNYIYSTSNVATRYAQSSGQHLWFTAPSGTANTTTITNGVSYTIITSGNQTAFGAANNNVGTVFTATSSGTLSSGTVSQNISFTQAMTLDASGNLGIGTSSPSGKLDVKQTTDTSLGGIYVRATDNNAAVISRLTTGNLVVRNGGIDSLFLDSSGNLGLGVSPSLWRSTEKAIQIGSWMGLFTDSGLTTEVSYNNYINSSNQRIYQNTGYALRYQQYNGIHSWHTAPSGTAGNQITGANAFDQMMTLNASGNLGLGTTSPSTKLVVSNAGAQGFEFNPNASGLAQLEIYNRSTAAYYSFRINADDIRFHTGASVTERARITSGGYFKASDSGAYLGSTGAYHELRQTANDYSLRLSSANASLTEEVLQVYAERNTTNNTFYAIRYYNNGAAAYKFQVADSGNVTNTNGSYGTISDAKMKTDIVDAGSQWDDLKAVRFRKFKMKDDPQQITQLGVVAQELEQTSPGLVDEHADRDAEGNDLGTTTKSVKSSILLMKAAVALQEAMARIEKLEAEMALLKGA
jgi:hypothetical protein